MNALPACLPSIRQALSNPRLDAYRAHSSEDELDIVARYAWNMALGASLYVPLHLLEVTLRNALHTAITHHHGGNERWFQLRHAFHAEKTWDIVNQVLNKTPNLSAPDAPGRVVAALDFGFWTTLLTSGYGRPPSVTLHWRPLWPQLVPLVFPHYPAVAGTRRDREILAERFDNIWQLRNRVSHHEPIWKGRPGPLGAPRVELAQQYDEVIEALGWINPDMVHATNALSTFLGIHSRGMQPFRTLLAGLP